MARRFEEALDMKLEVLRELERESFDEGSREWHDRELDLVRDAEPVFVSGDVVRLVTAAFEGFLAEPLLPTDLLIQHGFALLDAAVADVTEFEGDEESPPGAWEWPCDAVLWKARDGGLSAAFLSRSEGGASVGPASVYREVWWPYGEARAELVTEAYAGPDDHAAIRSWEDEGPVEDRPGVRWLQVLFRMAQQRLASGGRQRAPRSTRRRAARAGSDDEDVTVITLRRRKPRKAEGESPVDWRCRWLVRGHWRNQWYPSLQAHRQKWIAGYVKGPEGRELRVTDRAFEFVR